MFKHIQSCLTSGIYFISGIGLSLIYTGQISSIQIYFKKRIGLANSMANTGAGLAPVIFSPLIICLITSYGWRGAMIIQAGIVLHLLVLGSLIRPFRLFNGRTVTHEMEELVIPMEENTFKMSNQACQTHTISNHNYPMEELHNLNEENRSVKCNTEIEELMDAGNDTITNTLRSKPVAINGVTDINGKIHDSKATDINHQVLNKGNCTDKSHHRFNYLLTPSFFTFVIAYGTSCSSFIVPLGYLPDTAVRQGLSKPQGAMLVFAVGISSTSARVIFPWIGDFNIKLRHTMYVSSIMLGGLTVMAVQWCNSYTSLIAVSAVYGVWAGKLQRFYKFFKHTLAGNMN